MEKEIKQTWHFDQSPEEVWDYLTKPDLIEQWLMKSDFMPVVGHKFRFIHSTEKKSKYEGVVDCEVKEVMPYSRLSYSWSGTEKDCNRTFDSMVVWTLSKKGQGTELQLVHSGFAVLDDYEQHNKGWAMLVPRMTALLNANNK
jgi:uncharacterized protein YndB with AHSA1/START domain